MKKNFFMSVCLVLLSAFFANAQVNTVEDLFGEYKFTADVEFASEEYKRTYESILLGESDVTIEADAQYAGKIIGFAGSQQKLNIRAVKDNTIEMTNFNNPQLWNNLFMANGKAEHPNGVNENGTWISYPYNTEYYEYNPDTKVITVPTFTVVTVSGKTVTVVATFKNAKLTYVGGGVVKPETPAFDWTGEWTLNSTVSYGENYPSSFKVVVEYFEATEYNPAEYLVTSFMGNDILNLGGLVLTISEDGKSATLGNGLVAMIEPGVTYLKLYDGNLTANPIALTLNEDGTVSMADFTIVSGGYADTATDKMTAWYQNVVLTKGEGTSIDDVVVENGAAKGIFDIQGRKIEQVAVPGLYIIDGKKRFVR